MNLFSYPILYLVLPAVLSGSALMFFYLYRYKDTYENKNGQIKAFLTLYKSSVVPGKFKEFSLFKITSYKLAKLGFKFTYRIFLYINIVISLFLSGVCKIVLENGVLAVVTLFVWLIFSHQMVDFLYRKKIKNKIDQQVQLMLQLLAEIYSVSDNLVQAFEKVVGSCQEPLRGELTRLILNINTNRDFHSSMLEFASNIDNRDINIFVHGIILANQFGVDCREVISRNAEVIRERMMLREELENETKGKKAIIIIFMLLLPTIFAWLFFGFSDAKTVFTDNGKGKYLLVVLLLTEYLCWYFDSRKGVADEI